MKGIFFFSISERRDEIAAVNQSTANNLLDSSTEMCIQLTPRRVCRQEGSRKLVLRVARCPKILYEQNRNKIFELRFRTIAL